MKNITKIEIIHTLADGSRIEDISKVVIPSNHPIYNFLADIIRTRLCDEKNVSKNYN